MKKFWLIALTIVGLALTYGCVTQKKKGAEPGWLKKNYHNLTSKYNYWFNANELFNLTVDKLNTQHKDNYNKLLELYPYATTDPSSARGDLDNVITKASKGIALHRIGDWTDDCYTLIGESQFLKRDYETAEATFKYIREEQDPKKKLSKGKSKKGGKKSVSSSKKKKSSGKKKLSKRQKKKAAAKKKKAAAKKKKEAAKNKGKVPATDKQPETTSKDTKNPDLEPTPTGNNPYEKGLSRTAAYPKAMIWYARTMIEREKYDEAEFLFRELESDPFFPPALRADLYTAEAELWIRQKKFDKAIDPLQQAITYTEKRKDRARPSFILAQLYDRIGQYEESYAAYETVLKSSPVYDMEFNARLHQTEAGWANGKISSDEAIKNLDRMTKDDKNLDYLDQIYFVIAKIKLKEGAKKDAIAMLRKSLDNNKGNTTQRAEAFITLADLFFEEEDFVQAKNYYDSTITVLPPTDERFKRASTYATNLTDIARLIKTIAANDSIVKIYNMGPDERKDLAKKIKKQREEEALAAAKLPAAAPATAGTNKGLPPAAGVKPSTFYFYNETFLKKGKKDFVKLWGDRKLEDNWRRSNRPLTGTDAEIAAGDSTQTNEVSDNELKDIFQSIPKSEAELAVIHLATYEAMYQLGTLYRDKLQNNKRCSGTLEDLQVRYPDVEKYEKEVWYYCFLAFSDLMNKERAKYYLDKLVAKYPNSAYARALTDPNFRNAAEEKEREMNNYYKETFTLFQGAKYKEAFDRCAEAPKKYGSQNPLMPKFALLSAMCTGSLEGNEAYCKALSEVIGRHPDSPEATRAKEIARLLSCKGFEVTTEEKKKKDEIDDKFTREDDKLHYFIVALTGDVRLDDIKAAISDYNRENHKLDQLRMSNIFLGTDTNMPLVVIRKFDNKEQAMRYFNEVKDKKEFLGETAKKSYTKEYFAVTQENYRRILKNKTLEGYREFFEENYVKK